MLSKVVFLVLITTVNCGCSRQCVSVPAGDGKTKRTNDICATRKKKLAKDSEVPVAATGLHAVKMSIIIAYTLNLRSDLENIA